ASEHAFAGTVSFDQPIEPDFADFAIRRHKLGPLLAVVVRNGARCAPDAEDILSRHWKKNAWRVAMSEIAAQRIANSFAKARIPALHFKGVPLARQNYPNPLWRHCGDMDLLVPPEYHERAQEALVAAGLRCSDPLNRLPAAVRTIAMHLIRDLAFDDSVSDLHLELHTRLKFSFRISGRANYPGFVPVVPIRGRHIATPPLDAGLAHYLLLHGATSKWARFKWLADLSPVMSCLGKAGREALAGWAERTGTVAATKAGLVLVRSAFRGLDLAPLDLWIDEPFGRDAIRKRAQHYLATLCDPDTAAGPAASHLGALHSAWLLNDSMLHSTQLLPHAAISSATRWLARRALQPSRTVRHRQTLPVDRS
ncbi:MAG: nucleotidyltransferase family protein, partial [Steroidobacteraceae bacterium]